MEPVQKVHLTAIDSLMQNYIPHYDMACRTCPDFQAWLQEMVYQECTCLLDGMVTDEDLAKALISSEGKRLMSAGIQAAEESLDSVSRESAVLPGCVAAGWANVGQVGSCREFVEEKVDNIFSERSFNWRFSDDASGTTFVLP